MGGGSGGSTLLKALAPFPVELTAIISMADNGSSTGVLRRAYGVLPPGDIRQCLLALSHATPEVQALFAYRFPDGPLESHTVGNILLTALEKTTGSFDRAVEVATEMLKTAGTVLPVSLESMEQGVVSEDGKTTVMGERQIDEADLGSGDWNVIYEPKNPSANPKVLTAIREANAVIIGPGSYYTSILPTLLEDVCEALRKTAAKLIFNANLVTTPNQNDGWSVVQFVRRLETHIGRPFDAVTYNSSPIPADVLAATTGLKPIALGDATNEEEKKIRSAPIAQQSAPAKVAGDHSVRAPIRHDPKLLGPVLFDLINRL